MRNGTYCALGVLGLFVIVGVCYLAVEPSVDTVEPPSEPEPLEVGSGLKAPPLGENFATGHWEGDTWRRTVPPAPETVMHEGEAMTIAELYSAAYGGESNHDVSWAEKVAIFNRIIAEAPYSEEAYWARLTLANADRMRRASQIFRSARTPAEGMKALREADPELAKTLERSRR